MNAREQGDIGELSAMEWLAEQGARIYLPLGHSPDVDFVADLPERRLIRVQVKTTTSFRNGRWCPLIATRGGNQSWNRVAKYFSPTRCDYLFVHVGDGRRWFIPADRIEATTGLVLGGPKYAEFEVERGRSILSEAA
jgi:hypothetical protein